MPPARVIAHPDAFRLAMREPLSEQDGNGMIARQAPQSPTLTSVAFPSFSMSIAPSKRRPCGFEAD
jgi:hypothetical protein